MEVSWNEEKVGDVKTNSNDSLKYTYSTTKVLAKWQYKESVNKAAVRWEHKQKQLQLNMK